MSWKILLAYITGTVDQELLVRNEYLVTENRILRNQMKGRLRLSDGERKGLAAIGQKLGKQALKEIATIVKPDTILSWHRKFVAQKFDGSQQRRSPGRPTIDKEAERWVRSIKEECLSRLILFGEATLRHALTQYVEHFHHERNHQGKGHMLLFPAVSHDPEHTGPMRHRERLGGLLNYYAREAA
jgi:hypothetical protein